MKRMLINATQPEELRVAMVDGQKLYNLDIEVPAHEQKKANIYKAKITRIEQSLEAAFVDYGAGRHGFLPFKEINKRYCVNDAGEELAVKDALGEGMELIVQIEKEERGNKGAALTTNISLAGRYLVAMPHNPRAGGVSRRIEGDERNMVRDAIKEMQILEHTGVIVRTAGVGRSSEELQADLDYLMRIWDACEKAAQSRPAPFLIYQESDIIIRTLRDHYRDDIGEILIDEENTYRQARDFMTLAMPEELAKLNFYDDLIPLFNRYQIESQIETAFSREVHLKSGGALVIDPTEALTSIDVNSARATKGSDIADTAFNTNIEAAEEIARQLRLRDLGGLVVIDFIDMNNSRHQREVENTLREALRLDRARVQITRISKFGLLEMSRQRLRPSLGESSKEVCPRCEGSGMIRSVESTALAVLRICEEEALKATTSRVVTQVPIDVAAFLVNEKRQQLADVEARNKIEIVVVPNKALERPHYVVERVRASDAAASSAKASYEQATVSEQVYVPELRTDKSTPAAPAVQGISLQNPPPGKAVVDDSFWGKVLAWFGLQRIHVPAKPKAKPAQNAKTNQRQKPKAEPKNRNNAKTANNKNNRANGSNQQRNAQNAKAGQNNNQQNNANQNNKNKNQQRRGNNQNGGQNQNQNQSQNGAQNQNNANKDQNQRNRQEPKAAHKTENQAAANKATEKPARKQPREEAAKAGNGAPTPAHNTEVNAPEPSAAQLQEMYQHIVPPKPQKGVTNTSVLAYAQKKSAEQFDKPKPLPQAELTAEPAPAAPKAVEKPAAKPAAPVAERAPEKPAEKSVAAEKAAEKAPEQPAAYNASAPAKLQQIETKPQAQTAAPEYRHSAEVQDSAPPKAEPPAPQPSAPKPNEPKPAPVMVAVPAPGAPAPKVVPVDKTFAADQAPAQSAQPAAKAAAPAADKIAKSAKPEAAAAKVQSAEKPAASPATPVVEIVLPAPAASAPRPQEQASSQFSVQIIGDERE